MSDYDRILQKKDSSDYGHAERNKDCSVTAAHIAAQVEKDLKKSESKKD